MKARTMVLCLVTVSLILSACAGKPTPDVAETFTAQTLTPESLNQPAATPTMTATENPYLLYDEFDDPNSGWSTFGDPSSGEVGYANGSFRLAFYQAGYFNSSYSRDTYTDFIVETRVCTSATTPGIGAGLTLRASDYNWYLFWVYPVSREYSFSRGFSNPQTGFYQETSLLPRTSSDMIQPFDSDGMLCLFIKAAAHGDTFDFWVAGEDNIYQTLASARDAELADGHLGPSADAPKSDFSPAPVEALFDWIKVYPYSD
jgi:hypothetical protein